MCLKNKIKNMFKKTCLRRIGFTPPRPWLAWGRSTFYGKENIRRQSHIKNKNKIFFKLFPNLISLFSNNVFLFPNSNDILWSFEDKICTFLKNYNLEIVRAKNLLFLFLIWLCRRLFIFRSKLLRPHPRHGLGGHILALLFHHIWLE